MRGVITISDSTFFEGTQLLIRSLHRISVSNICVFDMGLLPEQRKKLQDQVMVITEQASAIPHIEDWRYWYKPFVLSRSPFRYTIWLDSDIVVLNQINTLFEMSLRSFQVFRESYNPAIACNYPTLYENVSVPFKVGLECLNAGVIGFDLERDWGIIAHWQALVRQALRDEKIRQKIRWHDQGVLLWLYQLTREFEISQDMSWNTPAIRNTYVDNDVLFDNLQRECPGSHILHWNARPKLWSLLVQPCAPPEILTSDTPKPSV